MTAPAHSVRDQRREQILAAAAEVFAANGVEATRVHDVAAAAGVAYGLVYHYFGSKQGLLDQIFDEAWAAFGEALDGIAASPRPAPDKVRAALDYVLGAWTARPALLQVVVHAARRPDALTAVSREVEARSASPRPEGSVSGTQDRGARASDEGSTVLGAAVSDPRAHPRVHRALASLEGLYAQGPLAPGVDPALLTRLLLGALEAAVATSDLRQPPPASLRPTLLRVFRDAPFSTPAQEVPCTSR